MPVTPLPKLKGDLNYLRLEWGPDFPFNNMRQVWIGADRVPILTTSSAELAGVTDCDA